MKKKYESQLPTNKIKNNKIEKKIVLKNKNEIDLNLSKPAYRWILKNTSFGGTINDNYLSSCPIKNITKSIT